MFSEEFRQKLYASAASKMRNGKPLSVEEQAATLYALDQAAQHHMHLTGGESAANQALPKPEVSSAPKQNPVPPTRK